jgi:hypothetical protein
MHHLFLGLSVKQLALLPFVPSLSYALDIKAHEFASEYSRHGLVIDPQTLIDSDNPERDAAKMLVDHIVTRRKVKAAEKVKAINGKRNWNPRLDFENLDGNPNRKALEEFEWRNRN